MFCLQFAFSILEAFWTSFWARFWIIFGLIWASWGTLGLQEAQMSPKVIQNRAQNDVQKASKMENANCEQNMLFTMF